MVVEDNNQQCLILLIAQHFPALVETDKTGLYPVFDFSKWQ
jgi:hypothetical protein